MIRRMSLWFAIVMMIVTITGCGQNAAAGKGGIKIFFSLNEADTFRQTLVDGAAEQAAQMGAQFVMEDAQGSIEEQVAQLKRAAAEGYDVIICSP